MRDPGDMWLNSYLNRESRKQADYEQAIERRATSDEWVLKPGGDENRLEDYLLIEDIPPEDRWIYGLEDE